MVFKLLAYMTVFVFLPGLLLSLPALTIGMWLVRPLFRVIAHQAEPGRKQVPIDEDMIQMSEAAPAYSYMNGNEPVLMLSG